MGLDHQMCVTAVQGSNPCGLHGLFFLVSRFRLVLSICNFCNCNLPTEKLPKIVTNNLQTQQICKLPKYYYQLFANSLNIATSYLQTYKLLQATICKAFSLFDILENIQLYQRSHHNNPPTKFLQPSNHQIMTSPSPPPPRTVKKLP